MRKHCLQERNYSIHRMLQQTLKEAYNHDSSKEKITEFIQGPVTKWFNKYGYEVIGPDKELPSIPSDEWHSENCTVKYTIKNDEKTLGKYQVHFQWAPIFYSYSSHNNCNELLAIKVMGFKPNKSDNEDWLKEQNAELQAVGQFIYKMETVAKLYGLDVNFKYKNVEYISSQEFDFTVTDIEGSNTHGKHLDTLTPKDWNREAEKALIEKYDLIPLPKLTFSKKYGSEVVESRYYIFGKGTENTTLVRVFEENSSDGGCLNVIVGCTTEYSDDVKYYYLTQEEYKDPEVGIATIEDLLC